MSFLDHLEELRWHLVRSAGAIIVFAILAFINKTFIFDNIIMAPRKNTFFTNRFLANLGDLLGIDALKINTSELKLISTELAGQFMAHLKISFVAGVIIACPYIIWEIWRFIKPALYSKEQKYASGAVFFISMLFIMGVLFGYYLIVPLTIHFLGSYFTSVDVDNTIKLGSYMSTLTSVPLATGVVFQLPMFSLFLSKVGLLTPDFMKKYRKHAFIVLLLLSAIITPPDIISQVMVCLPLMLLYEVGIIVSRRIEKQRKKKEAEE
ncbi:twin-arginine translocase subunit TatC [Prolixibacteraceae bacterium JC049]|nr:twin-arginine translocase subunit TatC [Prolixibacteraceae bacterium JC049]